MERGQDWRRRPLIRLMRPCDILRSTSAAAAEAKAEFVFASEAQGRKEEAEFPDIFSFDPGYFLFRRMCQHDGDSSFFEFSIPCFEFKSLIVD